MERVNIDIVQFKVFGSSASTKFFHLNLKL